MTVASSRTPVLRPGRSLRRERRHQGQSAKVYVRFHAADATPSGRHPGIFALANSLAHEGRLSLEEYEWWRANNEWFENAYADPGKLDPALFDRTVHPMTTCWFKVTAHHLLDRIPGYLRLLMRYRLHRMKTGNVFAADEGSIGLLVVAYAVRLATLPLAVVAVCSPFQSYASSIGRARHGGSSTSVSLVGTLSSFESARHRQEPKPKLASTR